MAQTPDSLTQKEYRDRGYRVIKVETWKVQPYVRKSDFLGIFDYMAFNEDDDMFCIQTTVKSEMSKRRKKILSSISFPWWVKTKRGYRRAMLHGWEFKKNRWILHEEELTMDDWHKFQKEKKEREDVLDENSPLFKELFPDGLPEAQAAA